MAWTTGILNNIFRAISGTGDANLLVLEKADETGVVAQAGAHNGLVVEGVAGGVAVPVSGTVTATVDVSTLATHVLQTALNALAATPETPTAITPSDATDTSALTTKGIKVSGAGTLVVKALSGGADVTYTAVAGDYFPCNVSRVMAASTATGIVGLS